MDNNSIQGAPPVRGQWNSRLGFILAAAGSAVGLGNIWKFPYITGENGGGLFVLIYLGCIAMFALPLVIAEIVIGRAAQKSVVPALGDLSGGNAVWRMVGWLGVVAAFLLLSFYSVVAGWAFNYIELAFADSFSGQSPEQVGAMFSALYGDHGRNVFWHTLFMGLTIFIVAGGVQKGIEIASRILMPMLFVLLGGLMVYAFTRPGFGDAVGFLFLPNADKLSAGGALEALGHSFFSQSVGMGALITYGSYLRRTDDAVASGLSISVLDTAVAFMACLTMFPILFSAGMPAAAGPGMVFVSMPTAFSQMPGGPILGVLFFVLLLFAALTSAVSLLEIVVATLIDTFNMRRMTATLGAGGTIFLFGLMCAKADFRPFPSWLVGERNFFDSVDWVVSNALLPVGGLIVSLFVGWVMPRSQSHEQFITGSRMGYLYGGWLFLLRYVVPVGILGIVLQSTGLLKLFVD